jgi:diamine N-acetyltransferase
MLRYNSIWIENRQVFAYDSAGSSNVKDASRPIVNIEGENVSLGPLRSDLIPLYTVWRNDFSTAKALDKLPRPIAQEERAAWFEKAIVDSSSVQFTIYERPDLRPIGLGNLHDLDLQHGTAELGIIIGEDDARGKGYGTEATRLLLDYAFTAVGLHNVMLRVYAFNAAGIRAYEKAGFQVIGRRRESHLMAGRRWDEIFMECLANDFQSPLLGKIFAPDTPRF